MKTTLDRASVEELIRSYGHGPSIALLDPCCHLFYSDGVEGVIGYRVLNGLAIVYGDPVCPDEAIPQLLAAFQDYCKENKWGIIFVLTTRSFTEWTLNNGCKAMIQIAYEQIINPSSQPDPRKEKGKSSRSLRNKLQQALREGLVVKEYTEQQSSIEKGIQQVADEWLKKRRGPQIFLTHIDFFAHRQISRWFYVEKENTIWGILLLHRLDNCGGYVLNFLMTKPAAPHGASELLIMTVLEELKKEKCSYLSLGIVPANELTEIKGFGLLTRWLASCAFKISKLLFKISGQAIYWKKYQPQQNPIYVTFSKSKIGLKEILAIWRSFNGSL